jgi:hypothetical protein
MLDIPLPIAAPPLTKPLLALPNILYNIPREINIGNVSDEGKNPLFKICKE